MKAFSSTLAFQEGCCWRRMLASMQAMFRAMALMEAPLSLATLPTVVRCLAAVHQALGLMDAGVDAPSSLATLPAVLLPEVVRWLPSPLDVARVDCTSRLFHLGTPRSAIE